MVVNIVYMHSHDTGRYVQPYGYAVPTPRIQELAEEGVLFRQAFSAAPTCSPSRAALLTGKYPHEVGMLGLEHRGFALSEPRSHLSSILSSEGYSTVLAGLCHLAEDPTSVGYEEILEVESNRVSHVAPAACDHLRRAPQEPFFLDVGFQETHRPFPEADGDIDSRYVRPPAPLPDTPQTRADMAAYHASARDLDGGIGAVLDALEETGLAENTLVICTTDHGLAFPWMKCTLSDGGIGVMLIMRGPGVFRDGKVVDSLVSQIDIVPTVLESVGAEARSDLRGVSLVSVVNKGEGSSRIFAESNYHVSYQPERCVRSERYKYIRSYEPREDIIYDHIDDGLSKQYLEQYGWRDRGTDSERLFDVIIDPAESVNLAGDSAYQSVLDSMRGHLDTWMDETNDPLLQGPVRPPRGADVKGAPS